VGEGIGLEAGAR